MADIRMLKDRDTSAEGGYLQKDFILKQGVKIDLTLTRTDNSTVDISKTISVGKEAKFVFMVQIKDLGNWDSRPAEEGVTEPP
jgi:hypothetical protein